MPDQPAETPEQMNDRRRIRDLIDAYAHCADRRDAAGQMALFTDEARLLVYLDVRALEEASQSYRGRDAPAPVFAALNAYEATTHFDGQNSLTFTGDVASGECYCLAYHVTRRNGRAELMAASIRYLDSFTRTDAGWRFAERKLMVDWTETRPLGAPLGH